MTNKLLKVPTLVYILLFAVIFFITNYITTISFGKVAFANDNVTFDIPFGGFIVFNFLFNFIGTVISWVVLSAVLYAAFYITKVKTNYNNLFKVVLLGEFIFFIEPFNTIVEFLGRNDYVRAGVTKSLHFFELSNLLSWFKDIPILNSFDVLNILYFLLVVYLISVAAKIPNRKAFGIASWVFIPIFLIKQLFWMFMSM